MSVYVVHAATLDIFPVVLLLQFHIEYNIRPCIPSSVVESASPLKDPTLEVVLLTQRHEEVWKRLNDPCQSFASKVRRQKPGQFGNY